MKVIDLLNKIANEEKVPDAIKWGCHDFEWFVYEYKAKGELGEPTLLDYLSQCPQMLNDEIITFYKIEEEKKIPEKLETHKEVDDEDYFANILKVSKNGECEIDEATSVIVDKINEIIDYLKSKGE